MATNLRNSANVTDVGSGKAVAWTVHSTTNCRTSDYIILPWSSGSEITDDTPVNQRPTEGSTQFSTDGARTVTFKMTIMQTDKAAIELLNTTYRDNYFAIVKEDDEDAVNGVRKYFTFGKAKPQKSLTYTRPGGTFDYTWTIEKPTGTVSSIDLSALGTTLGFSDAMTGTVAPADVYYTINEIAES